MNLTPCQRLYALIFYARILICILEHSETSRTCNSVMDQRFSKHEKVEALDPVVGVWAISSIEEITPNTLDFTGFLQVLYKRAAEGGHKWSS